MNLFVSRRLEWTVSLAALAAAVIVRTWPFLWWPALHFDSDQGVVGLMAKHISEGRAFPLFFYGQTYMLAVESWLAAPVMFLFGATVAALKAPLLVINLALVVLFVRVLVTEAGFRPALATVAALPLALPAAGVAARVMEPNSGNVEPWLYAILLWMLRSHWWAFGLLLGVASAHREFAVYGAVAIFFLDAIWGVAAPREPGAAPSMRLPARWAIIAVLAVAVRTVIDSVEPFANALGPGSRGNDAMMAGLQADPVGARLCFAPERWMPRARLLVSQHLPQLVGGMPGMLFEYGLRTSVPAGFAGLAPLVAAMTAAGAASAAAGPRTAGAVFGWYLVLVGLISTAVYGFVVCSPILVDTLRYNLLGVMMPAGALVLGLSRPVQSPVSAGARAGFIAVAIVWASLNASDVVTMTREYLERPPVDLRQAMVAEMERRGIHSAWSEYRFAYHLSFISGERVRVSANDYVRVKAYYDEAAAAKAPTLTIKACDGGDELIAGVYLCR
jgi:hypothetical protein